jgi:DNA invertase Pin-like site-specific DNA recombinase
VNPLPERDATAVVSYIRTSSAEQGKAYGPVVQRMTNRAFATVNGLRIVAEVHEDVSGTVRADDRAGMQDAISAAYQHGASSLLIAERSRLARDEFVAHDALRSLRGVGLGVVYADGGNGDDDSALLMDGIGHVIAAHDRRRIVARLKAGRDAKAASQPHSRAQGGKLPFGYRRDSSGAVVVDVEAGQQVHRAFEMVRDGKSIAKAAALLNAEHGTNWTAKSLDRVLRREIYKRRNPGQIVSPALWKAAHDAMASRVKRPSHA